MNLLVKYMGYSSYNVDKRNSTITYVVGLDEGNWELFKWVYYERI